MPTALRTMCRAVLHSLFLLTAISASAQTLTVGSPTAPCDARDVGVPLIADQPATFVQMSFVVTFDPAQLSFSDVTLSHLLDGWSISPTSSPGRVTFLLRPPSRLSLVGSFATLGFRLVGQPASRITVNVSEIAVLISTGTTVNGTGAPGRVLLNCDPLPSGEHPRGLQFRHLAGEKGGPGSVDGRGTDARFGRISGIAIAEDGTLFVADRGSLTIRRVTRDGVVTTLAGQPGRLGTQDGNGANASFVMPLDLALGRDGTLYVLDALPLHTEARVRRVTPDGTVTTLFRQQCALLATNPINLCGYIMSIAVDARDTVYLLDIARVLRVMGSGEVSVVAGGDERGFQDGTGTDAAFETNLGSSLTIGHDGNIYVYDSQNRAVRKVTPDGITTTVAAGDPLQAYSNPAGIAVTADGTIILNHAGTLFRISVAGVVTETTNPLLGSTGRFALGRSGEMHLAYGYNEDELWRVDPDGSVRLVAGQSVWGEIADGRGELARLNATAMTYNRRDGLLYTIDRDPYTQQCSVRSISLDGDVRTMPTTQNVCGDFVGAAPDGSLIAIEFPALLNRIAPSGKVTPLAVGPPGCFVQSLAVDLMGNAYVSCGTYLAKVTPSGSFVVAVEDLVTENLTVLPNGHVIAGNQFRLLRITPEGRVLPFAGSGLFPLEPDATPIPNAFGFTRALAADSGGGVYVVDVGFYGNWALLKHVTPSGDVTTIAGGGIGRHDGDASVARFAYPKAIAALPNGGVAILEDAFIRIGMPKTSNRRRSVRH